MSLKIESPHLTDIEELLSLYFMIYGKNYPIRYGFDPKVMAETMNSPDHLWLITRDPEKKGIVGSVIYELDRINKLGKVAALVVHPSYRKKNIASKMIAAGDEELLSKTENFCSIYTTTRTLSVGPQLTFLRQGYVPLGIFPNAHKLKYYETTTLMAKFRPGVLESRAAVTAVPKKIRKLYETVQNLVGLSSIPDILTSKGPKSQEIQYATPLEFELLYAPSYVHRKFLETFSDPYDRFYPFHEPNLLIASTGGEIEIYAHFSKADRYCTIIALTEPAYALAGPTMTGLLDQLKDEGVSYVEVLIGVDRSRSIEALLTAQFLPSALYPAMRHSNGKLDDFVVLTRSMEPLNFRGMAIAESFKPYVDQYVEQWKKMHLDSLEIFHEQK